MDEEREPNTPEEEGEEESLDVLDMEEFVTLGEELDREKTSSAAILTLLDGKAMMARDVGTALGVEKYPTIYGKLDRMAKAGLLLKRYRKGKNAFYIRNPNPPGPDDDLTA